MGALAVEALKAANDGANKTTGGGGGWQEPSSPANTTQPRACEELGRPWAWRLHSQKNWDPGMAGDSPGVRTRERSLPAHGVSSPFPLQVLPEEDWEAHLL